MTEGKFRIQKFGKRRKVVWSQKKAGGFKSASAETYRPPEYGPTAADSQVLGPSLCGRRRSPSRESTSLSPRSDSGNSLPVCSLRAAPGLFHVPWRRIGWSNPLRSQYPQTQGAETRLSTGCWRRGLCMPLPEEGGWVLIGQLAGWSGFNRVF